CSRYDFRSRVKCRDGRTEETVFIYKATQRMKSPQLPRGSQYTVQWPRQAARHCVGATSVYLNQEPFGLHAAWKKASWALVMAVTTNRFSNKSGWLCEGAAGRRCVIL